MPELKILPPNLTLPGEWYKNKKTIKIIIYERAYGKDYITNTQDIEHEEIASKLMVANDN